MKNISNATIFLVAGSRNFNNYSKLDEVLSNYQTKPDYIMSGCAAGADSLAIEYAERNDIPCIEVKAKWDDLDARPYRIKYNNNGKPYNALAGYNRNEKMATILSECKNPYAFIFWDGKSHGTKHMIKMLKEYKIPYTVVEV